jgi:hypothetical protein
MNCNKNLISIFFAAFFLLQSCNSHRDKENKSTSNCHNTDKIDSLIQQVTLIPDLYRSIPEDSNDYRYIVANTLSPKRDIYRGYWDTLYLVPKNLTLKNETGTMIIDSTFFNHDTTNVNVVVSYFVLGKYKATTAFITFDFDSTICNWKKTRISVDVH